MLQSLVELARQTSSDSRRDVLHALSRLLVEGAAAHNPRELDLFDDILRRLIDQVGDEDRLALSLRVARTPQTPHKLALKLASDQARIAEPILEFSPVLDVSDLVDIAAKASPEHLLAIARRAGIVEPITDAIIARGEIRAVTTATRNLSARFSAAGFGQVATHAMIAPAIAEALSLRPDLPVEIARKIITTLQPDAKGRVELLLRQNGDHMDDLIGRAMLLLEPIRSEQGQHRFEVRRMLADIRSGHRSLDDAIDELVFQRRLADVAALLADLAEVSESHASGALHKVNPTAIGVICRFLGLGDITFRRLCCLRCEKLRLPVSQAEQMLRDYANIDLQMAQQSIRYHRVRDLRVGPAHA